MTTLKDLQYGQHDDNMKGLQISPAGAELWIFWDELVNCIAADHQIC